MTTEGGFPRGVPGLTPPRGGSQPGTPREPFDHNRRSEGVPGSGTPSPPGRSERGVPVAAALWREPPDAPPAQCAHGDTGRVLPGRHLNECPGHHDGTCQGCLPCPRAHCNTCRREHAAHTCPGCVGRARDNLAAILNLTQLLPNQATNGRHAYHHHGDDIPGGDATVMLTPAASQRAQPLNADDPHDDRPGDVRPPLDVLAHWCLAWGGYRPHATRTDQLVDAARYLADQLHHIAKHPAFPHLAHDLARIVTTLENVLHAGDRPDMSRVPCLDCGHRLHKVWADRAAHDHWRCPVCGQTYDQGRYERAQHDQLASRGADRYVPIPDAIAAIGRPGPTVRGWVNDGTVAARRTTTGRVEVWWPHVRQRHLTTPTRKRRANDPTTPQTKPNP